MSKTFTYTKQTVAHYLPETDEIEYDGIDFDYEVSDDDLLSAVCDFLYTDYFAECVENKEKAIDRLKALVSDNDLLDWLCDAYEESLKDHFADNAFIAYEERL